MLFNSTDKSTSIIGDIDFLLYGDSTTFNTSYSLADRTRNVNISLDEVVAELFKADPEWSWDDDENADFPIATTDLVSGRDHISLPDSTLVISRVRVKNSLGNWITLEPKGRREFTDAELIESGVPEAYYKLGRAVFPVPIPNYGVTSGVELEFQRGANHFETTDVNVFPGFNSQFHQYLSVGAAYRYALANGLSEKTAILNQEKQRIIQMIKDQYQTRNRDEKPRMTIKRSRNYAL